MVIDNHIDVLDGRLILEWTPGVALPADGSHAVRLSLNYEQQDAGRNFLDLFAAFVAQPGVGSVRSLVIGDWGLQDGVDSSVVVEALTSARDLFPQLEALFLAEIICEESEISWIRQSDVSPLFGAFANLKTLCIRGGDGLRLGRPRHRALHKLVIETGGMASNTMEDVVSAELPSLEHLELWLGDDGYGNDITGDHIQRLLNSGLCMNLMYLGLRNDCHADETVRMLCELGLPPHVKTLDLSLGSLSDEGARLLAGSPLLSQLDLLDIHFHYVSPEMISQLQSRVRTLDATDPREADDWDGVPHRYVAVSE